VKHSQLLQLHKHVSKIPYEHMPKHTDIDSAIRVYEKSLAVTPSILVHIRLTKIAIEGRNLGDEACSSGITPTTIIDHLCKHLMC
jgi:hypothetical protein